MNFFLLSMGGSRKYFFLFGSRNLKNIFLFGLRNLKIFFVWVRKFKIFFFCLGRGIWKIFFCLDERCRIVSAWFRNILFSFPWPTSFCWWNNRPAGRNNEQVENALQGLGVGIIWKMPFGFGTKKIIILFSHRMKSKNDFFFFWTSWEQHQGKCPCLGWGKSKNIFFCLGWEIQKFPFFCLGWGNLKIYFFLCLESRNLKIFFLFGSKELKIFCLIPKHFVAFPMTYFPCVDENNRPAGKTIEQLQGMTARV